ncbi:MAG: hypothetical protein J6K39_02840 [Clostridia bacterium]|nr:hypothetical protein [Clostridia bacterium]
MEKKVEIKVREDLQDIVKSMGWNKQESRYGVKFVFDVKFYNNEVISFNDKDGLYGLLKSYQLAGDEKFVKSKKLVEELKSSSADFEDDEDGTASFFCVRFDLFDGGVYRLFPSGKYDKKKIANFYRAFKAQQKTASTPAK